VRVACCNLRPPHVHHEARDLVLVLLNNTSISVSGKKKSKEKQILGNHHEARDLVIVLLKEALVPEET